MYLSKEYFDRYESRTRVTGLEGQHSIQLN